MLVSMHESAMNLGTFPRTSSGPIRNERAGNSRSRGEGTILSEQQIFGFARVRKARRGKRLGRPKQTDSRVRHGAREKVKRYEPQHVTLRMVAGLPSLRTRLVLEILWQVFLEARDRHGMRVCHWVVLSNHIHLIVEAEDEAALARGMNGLLVRISRRVNKAWGRRGKFFDGRYHVRALGTPTEARRALRYVLLNAEHHGIRTSSPLDPFSSAAWFGGWSDPVEIRGGPLFPPVAEPRGWLLRSGWQRGRSG